MSNSRAATRSNPMLKAGLPGFWLCLFLGGFVWLSASRLLLVALNASRLTDAQEITQIFLIGLRMDSVLLCYLLALPLLLDFLLPGRLWRQRLVLCLLTLLLFFLFYLEVATPGFMDEFDVRPDRIFYEYLSHLREVLGTLLKERPVMTLGGTLFVFVLTWAALRGARVLRENFADWSWIRRLLLFPLMLALLFLGARGTLGHRPVNLSTAAFSNNHVANELALNSSYTLIQAIYNTRKEVDVVKLYGDMPWAEALQRVRRYMNVPAEDFTHEDSPTLHRQVAHSKPVSQPGRPPNIVIYGQESMGAGFVGSLGGLPLTPNLDRLSAGGLWFTQMFATGTRTVRGMEALITGFAPTPAPSVLKLPKAQRDFFTLASLLKRHGYATEFIYGGVSNFDNMGKFFLGNGFDRVIEQRDFGQDVAMMGTWGASDEDLVAKANETFKAHGDQPFFAFMMSTSNHSPFEYPAGRFEPYEQPPNTRKNAVKYSDYAIGKLFELAQKEPYYANTIFLVVADHDAHVFGQALVPVEHFHIPALIIGPGVPKAHYDRLSSQLDLLPTLLGFTGLEVELPAIGRDLMSLPPDQPGRAMMQYGNANGFRVGDKLAVLQPHQAAQTFYWRDGALTPAPQDAELEKDALAHLVWAAKTYKEGLYRLDAGEKLP